MSHTTSVSVRLAWSLVAALTSADGWQAFILGLRRLLVSTRPATSRAQIRAQIWLLRAWPSELRCRVGTGLTVSSLALPYGRMHKRGLRWAIGPRTARLHVGAGGTGVSTGAGPVS